MATAKARTVNPREGVGYQIDSAGGGVAVLEEAGKVTTNAADSDEGLSFSLVNFRNPDPFLNTPGLSTGEPISSGRFTGAVVKGLFGIPLGCIIELEHGGRVVTLLNTGEYSGVLK